MARPSCMEFGNDRTGIRIPILYEDRSILAIDKPAGWLLVPFSWQQTQRNLQAAITSSIAAGEYWAKSRNLRFLRHLHRLDGETSGILLFGKSPGAVQSYTELFESREVSKTYLVVVRGSAKEESWTCDEMIGPDPKQHGRMRVDPREGKESRTHFRVLDSRAGTTLIEAEPVTGRTHQIRIHLLHAGLPVVGDVFYGPVTAKKSDTFARFPMALRAVAIEYTDPFTRRRVHIEAPTGEFLKEFHFGSKPNSHPAEPTGVADSQRVPGSPKAHSKKA